MTEQRVSAAQSVSSLVVEMFCPIVEVGTAEREAASPAVSLLQCVAIVSDNWLPDHRASQSRRADFLGHAFEALRALRTIGAEAKFPEQSSLNSDADKDQFVAHFTKGQE